MLFSVASHFSYSPEKYYVDDSLEIPELSYCKVKGDQICKVKNILGGDLKRVLLNIMMSKVCV